MTGALRNVPEVRRATEILEAGLNPNPQLLHQMNPWALAFVTLQLASGSLGGKRSPRPPEVFNLLGYHSAAQRGGGSWSGL
ncbi:hypothetical protein EYF80_051546 [Liparis tanakae]|uniref:Uncharacterized protein n=1 Tax=Liparis tanakae TaxID=230148 RepID=A0A4Z2FBL5_9TELE|nr:hypothetical protein EYF80_051546 [Liparis tanakae]